MSESQLSSVTCVYHAVPCIPQRSSVSVCLSRLTSVYIKVCLNHVICVPCTNHRALLSYLLRLSALFIYRRGGGERVNIQQEPFLTQDKTQESSVSSLKTRHERHDNTDYRAMRLTEPWLLRAYSTVRPRQDDRRLRGYWIER